MILQNGQARIVHDPRSGFFIVTWRNLGNDLVPFPRAFIALADAAAFCDERRLHIVFRPAT